MSRYGSTDFVGILYDLLNTKMLGVAQLSGAQVLRALLVCVVSALKSLIFPEIPLNTRKSFITMTTQFCIRLTEKRARYRTRHNVARFFVPLLVLMANIPAHAETRATESCASEYSECAPIGKWQFGLGIGVGLRTNPLSSGDDLPIILLPSVSYYGERFFLENLRAGFTLFDNQRSHMMNAVVTVGLEQVYFEDVGLGNFFLDGGSPGSFMGGASESPIDNGGEVSSPAPVTPNPTIVAPPESLEIDLESIEKRKTAGLIGLEYQYNIRNLAFNIQALADATKVHSGFEGRWSISYPFNAGRNDFGIALGGIWQSADLLNYYYGVSARDINAEEALFTIEEGDMSAFVRLDWRREISKKWSLKATVQGKSLSRNIKNSPLVEDDTAFTVFFGGVYRF